MHEKRDILDALFKIVGDVIFAPFGYRPRTEVDFFLVHNQGRALQKLFMSCLKIKIKGAEVPLYVRLGVARFTTGHPNIGDKLFACIQERMNSAGE